MGFNKGGPSASGVAFGFPFKPRKRYPGQCTGTLLSGAIPGMRNVLHAIHATEGRGCAQWLRALAEPDRKRAGVNWDSPSCLV